MAPVGEDGSDLRLTLTAHQLDVVLRRLDALPAAPATVERLVELLAEGPTARGGGEDPDCQAHVVALIRIDPALTARILSLANASAPSVVVAVAEAVRKLGFEAVRGIVLGMPIAGAGDGGAPPATGLDRPGLWRHCLAVAAAAELLAPHCQPAPPREALFVAGLLHDLGKLALAECLPKSYARVLDTVRVRRGGIVDCERRILDTDHLVVGRRLAEQWRLPEPVQEAIWLHHQPVEAIPPAADTMLVGVVGLADAIARRQRIGFSGNYTFARSCEQFARQLGISHEAVQAVAERLGEVVDRHAAAAGAAATGSESVRGEVLAAANAELGRLNEQLRRRADALRDKADAFEHIHRFAAALRPDASVADILPRIASVAAALNGITPAPPTPVLAYAVEPDGDEVLMVRCDGGERPDLRAFARAQAFDAKRGERGESSEAAVASLLADPGDLSEWQQVGGYGHMPLLCGGRWIGGALFPRAGAGAPPPGGEDDVRHALAAVLALSLAIVQERQRAVRLGEQLAGASQALAETQEALAEAKMLAAVGEMAAGAAHEMNNPLAVVSGRAQLMRDRAASEQERKTWQLMAEQAQRVSDIISEMMQFASPPAPAPEPFAVAPLLSEAAARFSCSDHLHAGTVRVDIEADEDVPKAYADRAQMVAVVAELIGNAATAASHAPEVVLSAEADDANGAVLLTVRDSGTGMDEQTLARAFTPFFSAQKAGRRRGLGLPLAKRYVENNGGRIWLRTQTGKGTTAYVQIPWARGRS